MTESSSLTFDFLTKLIIVSIVVLYRASCSLASSGLFAVLCLCVAAALAGIVTANLGVFLRLFALLFLSHSPLHRLLNEQWYRMDKRCDGSENRKTMMVNAEMMIIIACGLWNAMALEGHDTRTYASCEGSLMLLCKRGFQ